jgi:hypothetical protein
MGTPPDEIEKFARYFVRTSNPGLAAKTTTLVCRQWISLKRGNRMDHDECKMDWFYGYFLVLLSFLLGGGLFRFVSRRLENFSFAPVACGVDASAPFGF